MSKSGDALIMPFRDEDCKASREAEGHSVGEPKTGTGNFPGEK